MGCSTTNGNKYMKKSLVQYIFVFLASFLVAGCYDELMDEEIIGHGKASISATLDFRPMSSSLARTRASGDVLNDITSLHVLLYDDDTKALIRSWKVEQYIVSDAERNNGDAENGNSAEVLTRRAAFKLPERIDFGKYYMYAVANIPDLLENESEYHEAIQSVDGLKSISLNWNSGDISANGQMLGYFTNPSSPSIDELLILNEKNARLHAWLRRAASKVTVAFDGSGLKDGVSIYIRSLRIKNIPASCSLGKSNTAQKTEDIIPTGEEVVYSTSSSYDASYPALITNRLKFYPRVQKIGDDGNISFVMDPEAHSGNSPYTLFFFENMQGYGPDKRQSDNDNDGVLDQLYEYKEKPYATYIEVDAYYESSNPERLAKCNITYRFMLGQNITTDYNAKRNCHYKLTLRFNGYADDPDWRIDHVTRLTVSQPEAVDYRGKYFVPDDNFHNKGNRFNDDNAITVTSFMYRNDSSDKRDPVKYRIEYKDSGSTAFTGNLPDWLDEFSTDYEGNGVFRLKINYKNPYREQNINRVLEDATPKPGIYDLSTKGGKEKKNTANCYIVDSKGTYQFPLVYGNAITNDIDYSDSSYTYKGAGTGDNYLKTFRNYKDRAIRSAYILDDIYDSDVPDKLSASLVWQDEPDLISRTSIKYIPEAYEGKGGIQFTVGAIKEGNAVIALKDPKDTIIWSWHIWVTALDLTKTIILTNASGQNFEIMPVNLGWCSGDIPVRYYDRHKCEVRITQIISDDGQEGISQIVTIVQEPHIALPKGNSPYYQWGRKDPFFAGGNADKTTKTWYDTTSSPKTSAPAMMYTALDDSDRVKTNKAIARLIQNPDKWQNGPRVSINSNAYRPDDQQFFNLWDNSCWDDNDVVVKTIYDPCPAGFHVSSIYTFSGFTYDGGQQGSNWNPNADISSTAYAATEENMMPKDGDSDTRYEDYRKGIFEFYTDRTKLISIGFPQTGYRDWDANAVLLKYTQGDGYLWFAQAVPWDWGNSYTAYNFEYNRATVPHIWPVSNFYVTDGFAVRPSRTLP